ncbi:MAG: helix-turn-helix transcriptional regulator [Methanobrevibacter sp.]|nr:helix-turn-helix transcriptional regulator [Methanobrevibacter sp.]
MNENLYNLFDDVLKSDFNVDDEGSKRIINLGENGEYGNMEMYSIFPGIIIAYIDMNIENMDDVFVDVKLNTRLLEINHCREGRYAYSIDDDKIIYFGKGDLCVSIYDLTKSISDFPLGYYKGFEIFIDVDLANGYLKEYIPNFDLIDMYEGLKKSQGYVLIRSNERIDHVIGELYSVDNRIKESYFKLKCLELLLFFSITHFEKSANTPLSKSQAEIVEIVKNDLTENLESQITIAQLAEKYGISKTTLKNCFKEVYGKPIIKWRKEYRLDYACRLIDEDEFTISEISKMVGYSSPSKFTQAFKDYIGCTPSEYRK